MSPGSAVAWLTVMRTLMFAGVAIVRLVQEPPAAPALSTELSLLRPEPPATRSPVFGWPLSRCTSYMTTQTLYVPGDEYVWESEPQLPPRSLPLVMAPQSPFVWTELSLWVPTETPFLTALPGSDGSFQSTAQPTAWSVHLSAPFQVQEPDTVAVEPLTLALMLPGPGASARTPASMVNSSSAAAMSARARRRTGDLI